MFCLPAFKNKQCLNQTEEGVLYNRENHYGRNALESYPLGRTLLYSLPVDRSSTQLKFEI